MKPPKYFFNLEAKPNNSGKHLIYFNLNYGFKTYNPISEKYHYKYLRLSTEYSILKDYWIQIKKTDSIDGEPVYKANQTYVRKFGKDLNVAIEKIKNLCITQLNLYRDAHYSNPEPKELKRLVLEKLNRIEKRSTDVLITKFIDKVILERRNLPSSSKKYWSKRTATQYNNLKAHIENYETRDNINLTFLTLNEKSYWRFFEAVNEIHIANQEKQFNEDKPLIKGKPIKYNTIAKIGKQLRVILGATVEHKIEIGFNWKDTKYKINEVKTENHTSLNETQLLNIFNKDVRHSKEFTNARNYILISSLTSLRLGDMTEVHNCKIETFKSNNKKFKGFQTRIRKSQENRDELYTIIPLTNMLIKILDENNGCFPSFPSPAVLGRQIKKFLKFIEFNDKVEFRERYYPESEYRLEKHEQSEIFTPHSCRYTFITNMSKLDVPENVVKNITHPTVKARTILAGYNLSSMADNAYKLIRSLKNVKSRVYKF
jgi:hypothetical protein